MTLKCTCGGAPEYRFDRNPMLGTEDAAQIVCHNCGRKSEMLAVAGFGDFTPTERAWDAMQNNIDAGAGI